MLPNTEEYGSNNCSKVKTALMFHFHRSMIQIPLNKMICFNTQAHSGRLLPGKELKTPLNQIVKTPPRNIWFIFENITKHSRFSFVKVSANLNLVFPENFLLWAFHGRERKIQCRRIHTTKGKSFYVLIFLFYYISVY